MKKIKLLFTLFLLISISVQAQVPPNAFNYSAVARDAAGEPIANTAIGIQVSILQGSTSGTSLYVENHSVNTDDFGQFDLVIGGGAVQSGSMENISWNTDDFYLQIGMDANGGTNFLTMGTTQLLSVPYALHAATADSLIGGSSTQIDSASIADMGFTTNSGCGLNIGDYHAGGIIFYLEPDGCHGLVVKENDEPGTYQLCCENTYGIGYSDCIYGGIVNTNELSYSNEFAGIYGDCDTTIDYAVNVCSNISHMGHNDWYLPSKHELSLAVNNLFMVGLGNFQANLNETANYWSSSIEPPYASLSNGGNNSVDSAWYITLLEGTVEGSVIRLHFFERESYDDEYYIRAIRKF